MLARSLLLCLSIAVLFGVGRRFLASTGIVSPETRTQQSSNEAIDDSLRRLNSSLHVYWKSVGVVSVLPAEEPTVLRRLSLALVGSIPSLEEIRAFETMTINGDGRLIDRLDGWTVRLLADERCHAYLAERLARTIVGVHWEPPVVYRRDRFVGWLAEQIGRSRPYDAVVQEMIADEGFPTDRPGLQFLTAASDPFTFEGPDPGKLAGRVAQAFLGVNLECAECHDHPFDVWTQQDFRGLAAFFQQTKHNFAGVRDVSIAAENTPDSMQAARAADKPPFGASVGVEKRPAVPKPLFLLELLPSQGPPRRRLAQWLTSSQNRPFARTLCHRVWAMLFGKPMTGVFTDLPVDGPHAPMLDVLADDFIEHRFDLHRLIRLIAACEAFRAASGATIDRTAVSPEQSAATAAFPLTRLRPEQLANSLVQVRSLATCDERRGAPVRAADWLANWVFRSQFGDMGESEFSPSSESVAQKLLLQNGEWAAWNTNGGISRAVRRIAWLAPDDASAVESLFLVAWTRRPDAAEAKYFAEQLDGSTGERRVRLLEDLVWSLINGSEFAWNH